MKMNYAFFIFLTLLSIKATSQMYQVSGRVKDYSTLDDLPFVNMELNLTNMVFLV
jgi:hypothetical protein